MSHRKAALGLLVAGLVTVLATTGVAFAQAGGGGGGGGGGRGGGRNFMANIQEQLGATDEEWNVLQPKIEKVMTLNREMMMGRFGGRGGRFGGRGGGGGGEAPATTSDIQDKTKALNDVLENKDSDPKDIAAKLAAVRDARERVRGDLVKAQAELKEVLTPRQEARLVLLGVLE